MSGDIFTVTEDAPSGVPGEVAAGIGQCRLLSQPAPRWGGEGRRRPRHPEGGAFPLTAVQTPTAVLWEEEEGNGPSGEGRGAEPCRPRWGGGAGPSASPSSGGEVGVPPGTDTSPTARTLQVGDEVMEKFNRAIKPLPMHIRLSFKPAQLEGELPGPAPAPWAESHQPRGRLPPVVSPILPRAPGRKGVEAQRPRGGPPPHPLPGPSVPGAGHPVPS